MPGKEEELKEPISVSPEPSPSSSPVSGLVSVNYVCADGHVSNSSDLLTDKNAGLLSIKGNGE